jgi:hypothetical protein
MTSTLEARASRFRTISVVLGILVGLQALVTLVVAFMDGAITFNAILLLAFLLPQLVQLTVAVMLVWLALNGRYLSATRVLFFGIIASDIIQSVGISLVWANFVPDALDPQSIIAALIPFSEFVLVGSSWYGNVGYALLGISWGLVFWASIAFGLVSLRMFWRGTLPRISAGSSSDSEQK